MSWVATAPGLEDLDAQSRASLEALPVATVPKGQTLFCPGEAARGFVVVLQGRVEVFLTGSTGRDILLYAVEPGESCVQSTLGLLGGTEYSGEALTATDCRLVLIPRDTFLTLMNASEPFRHFVFEAFAERMQGMLTLLERVAFQKVESRLAAALLKGAKGGQLHMTHAELAVQIGSAREVVSRRLDQMAKRGLVQLDRGCITLLNPDRLAQIGASDH